MLFNLEAAFTTRKQVLLPTQIIFWTFLQLFCKHDFVNNYPL